MKKLHYVGLIAIIFFLLPAFRENRAADCKDYTEFFKKNYGTMSPHEGFPSCNEIPKYDLLQDFFSGFSWTGDIYYTNHSDKLPSSQWNQASVAIWKYKTVDIIKADLLARFPLKEVKIEIAKNTSANYLFYKYYVVQLKRWIYVFGWISKDITVYINTDNDAERDELLNDYLTRFPPTEKFIDADLTFDYINRGKVKKSFQAIANAEVYRATQPDRPKFERFIGFMAQCTAEISTRMFAQIHDELIEGKVIGCPAAMEFDSAKRKEKFAALKKQVLAKTLDYDFNNIKLYEGVFPGTPEAYAYQVIEQLKMTHKDISELQASDAPKQFKMSVFE